MHRYFFPQAEASAAVYFLVEIMATSNLRNGNPERQDARVGVATLHVRTRNLLFLELSYRIDIGLDRICGTERGLACHCKCYCRHQCFLGAFVVVIVLLH